MIEIDIWKLVRDGCKPEPFYVVTNDDNKKSSCIPFDEEEESLFAEVTKIIESNSRKSHYQELSKIANMRLQVFVDWKPYGRYVKQIRVRQ